VLSSTVVLAADLSVTRLAARLAIAIVVLGGGIVLETLMKLLVVCAWSLVPQLHSQPMLHHSPISVVAGGQRQRDIVLSENEDDNAFVQLIFEPRSSIPKFSCRWCLCPLDVLSIALFDSSQLQPLSDTADRVADSFC